MNIFEKDAVERDESRQMQGILLAWGSFRQTVLQLIESYRQVSPEGRLYGADIEEPSERSIVIVCPRGGHPKEEFSALMITIRAEMVRRDKFAIECKIEQWRKRSAPGAPPHTDRTKSMNFVLGTDHASLVFSGEEFTPSEAANKLLETALIRK
jgi:hypothetical protein